MENNLNYTRNGDYLIPDLKLTEQPPKPLGKYGRMRKAYLKEHRPLIYNQLLMTEKLYPHLAEIDETANRRLEQMMPPLAESAGVTEQLKACLLYTSNDTVIYRIQESEKQVIVVTVRYSSSEF